MQSCRFVLKYSDEVTKGAVKKQTAAYNNSCDLYILDPQSTWDFDLAGKGS